MFTIARKTMFACAAAAAVYLSACSQLNLGSKPPTAALQASPKVPAAEGSVSVQDGDNGNYKVALNVKHMAPPEKVATGASSYVVWLRPLATDTKSQAPQNMGALVVNKDLEGNLTTVTPYRQFDLFVTAEPVPNSTAPTGEQLLTTTIRK